MRMKLWNPDMAQHYSGAFAAILAQPEKTPKLVSYAAVGRAAISIRAISGWDGEMRSYRALVSKDQSHSVPAIGTATPGSLPITTAQG
jgi:hypothetical protein